MVPPEALCDSLLFVDGHDLASAVLEREIEGDLVAYLDAVEQLGLEGHGHGRPVGLGNGSVVEAAE